jgi:hypothetical protein
MSIFDCPYTHTFIREIEGWAGFNDELLICPMREPRSVWLSWVKRHEKKVDDFSHLDLPLPKDVFELQYRHLEALDKEYDILYIPIERVERSEGHMKYTPKHDWGEPDWIYIYSLPFVRQYYVRLRPLGSKKDDNSAVRGGRLSANG